MSAMAIDLTAVAQTLTAIHARAAHLPHDDVLARGVLALWNRNYDPRAPVQHQAVRAVIAHAWTAGAAAGAVRGHDLAVDTIRAAVAAALTDETPVGPYGQRVFHAAIRAADNLPPRPEPPGPPPEAITHVGQVPSHATPPRQLADAIGFGLEHGWRSGHRAATTRAFDTFRTDLVSVVGAEALFGTILPPDSHAYGWLYEIEDTVDRAADTDQTHPPPLPEPATPAPAALRRGRAFAALQHLDPLPRTHPHPGRMPPTGPGRRPGPSR